MKSHLGAMALLAGAFMVSGQGSVGSSQAPYRPNPRKPLEPKPFPLLDTPKGHQTERLEFSFKKENCNVSGVVLFSYGTEKSKIKREKAMLRALKEYIENTPVNSLLEFGQFDLEPI